MPVRRYQLVAFDLDGTLIDSSRDIAAALDHALTALGYPPHSQGNLALEISGGVRRLLCDLGVAANDVDEAIRLYRAFYSRNPIEHTQLYPGVRDSLRALSPVPMAVATNKAGDLARRILAELQIAHHFIAVVGTGDVDHAKPDPCMLRWVYEHAGIAAESMLYVGDSPVDAAAASAAGVDFCFVAPAAGDPDCAPDIRARHRVHDLRDVVPLVTGTLVAPASG